MTGPDFTAWRTRLSLTQQAAAHTLGLHLTTVQRYETGKLTNIPYVVELACQHLDMLRTMKDWIAGADRQSFERFMAGADDHGSAPLSPIITATTAIQPTAASAPQETMHQNSGQDSPAS